MNDNLSPTHVYISIICQNGFVIKIKPKTVWLHDVVMEKLMVSLDLSLLLQNSKSFARSKATHSKKNNLESFSTAFH